MKPEILAVLSMLLYATGNVIINRKLAAIHPLINSAILSTTMAMIALSVLYFFHKQLKIELVMPGRWELLFLALCGVLYFLGDYLFFWAYHKGGTLGLITTVVAIFPVFAAIINIISGGSSPKITQLAGAGLGIMAVFLATL